MNNISKIIHLTPEQYLKILKNGSIEVNGEVKTYDDAALYDTGNLELITWYNTFMKEKYKEIARAHSPYVIKSLQQEYEDIIESDSNEYSKLMSAVGFRAILQPGDTIKISGNNGDFLINELLVENDYTFTGAGSEIVDVWVFEKNNTNIQLVDEPNYYISEIIIKNMNLTPEINDSYYKYCDTLNTYNFNPKTLLNCREIVCDGLLDINGISNNLVSNITKKLICYAQNFNNQQGSPLSSKSNLIKITFPELLNVHSPTNPVSNFLMGCNNPGLEISFPKLKSVAGRDDYNASFKNVYKVEFPPSLLTLGNSVCNGNSIIILNCNKATSILNRWCVSAPTINFTMAKDWQASINIAVAAKNHTKDWFIDLFTNYLHDFSGTGTAKELTIPIAVFNELSDEEIDIAENKGWTVGGA